MSSDSLGKQIPKLTGLNYASWSVLMKAYFQTLSVWPIVNRDLTCPVAGDAGKAAWITSDAFDSKATAKLKWDDLKSKYGEPNAMTTFMEFQRPICIQIKPKDDIMAKITETTMIMAAVQGQGIDLNDKIKALILVHSMSQAWEQAPVNILSSIAANQLGLDMVIPRMKEVWLHKSGKTMLPQQEKVSTSEEHTILMIITEENPLLEEVIVVKVDMVVFAEDVEVTLLILKIKIRINSKVLRTLMGTRTKIVVEAKARARPVLMLSR
ncbi:hypothetical protein BKA82DRAFT_4017380 [Pisolithus tinctorius]|nr:hypothetical protein BKA82DRAFT_4017380 [Pisolithus tinctorius]